MLLKIFPARLFVDRKICNSHKLLYERITGWPRVREVRENLQKPGKQKIGQGIREKSGNFLIGQGKSKLSPKLS